jgi:hypothetical protein
MKNSTISNRLYHEQILSSRTFADFVSKLPQSDIELATMLNIEPSTIYRWR